MKEVWICDTYYQKIRRSFALIFFKNYECFEKVYQTLERVFHQISKQIFQTSYLRRAEVCIKFETPNHGVLTELATFISGLRFLIGSCGPFA